MDLDDLKRRFEEQETKLNEALRLNAQTLAAPRLAKLDTAARRLRRVLWYEVIANAIGLLLVGSFLVDHIREPRFAFPAAALHVGLIALLVLGVRQLAALARLHADAPVAGLQARLEVLRASRLRATAWTLVAAPLAWTPLLVVAARGLLGADLTAAPLSGWLLANALLGVAVAVLAVVLSRRFAHAWPGGLGRLGRLLAGERVAEAERLAAELGTLACAA